MGFKDRGVFLNFELTAVGSHKGCPYSLRWCNLRMKKWMKKWWMKKWLAGSHVLGILPMRGGAVW